MEPKTVTGQTALETLATFNAEAHRLRESIKDSAMTEEGVRQHLGMVADLLIDITAMQCVAVSPSRAFHGVDRSDREIG